MRNARTDLVVPHVADTPFQLTQDGNLARIKAILPRTHPDVNAAALM